MGQVKLYLDEDIPIGIELALKSRGYDVVSTRKMHNLGATDNKQLEFAVSEGGCIVTRNAKDFILLAKVYWKQQRSHHGIILTRKVDVSVLVHALAVFIHSKALEEVNNQTWWI
ncbi:MAG: DUF5615 family PIN-like protein [Bacteroidota bacterium]|nr:DUF5615 family PIN-like protein [Bacteroidota bacterium]